MPNAKFCIINPCIIHIHIFNRDAFIGKIKFSFVAKILCDFSFHANTRPTELCTIWMIHLIIINDACIKMDTPHWLPRKIPFLNFGHTALHRYFHITWRPTSRRSDICHRRRNRLFGLNFNRFYFLLERGLRLLHLRFFCGTFRFHGFNFLHHDTHLRFHRRNFIIFRIRHRRR